MDTIDKIISDEAGTTVSLTVVKWEDMAALIKVVPYITVWNKFGEFTIRVSQWDNDERDTSDLANIILGEASQEDMVEVLTDYVHGTSIGDAFPEENFDDYNDGLHVEKLRITIYNEQCGHEHDCCGCGISATYELIPVDKHWVGSYTYSYNV